MLGLIIHGIPVVSAGTNGQCAHRRDILARHVAECCIHLPEPLGPNCLDSKERQKLFETVNLLKTAN